jgi:hypothetical protein
MEKFLKTPGLSEKILIELSKLSTIPSTGFLGGGAVANTILKMCWGGDYPINDLDIFFEQEGYGIPHTLTTPIRTDNLVIDDYIGLRYNSEFSYRITRVTNEGMLNLIQVSRVENRKDYSFILKGFDLNCCQVGIDLSKNELIYTDEFESFLETKQLDVTSMYTPAHTALRLLKKKDELNCYCNVDSCMELLSQPFLVDSGTINNFSFLFGEKYKLLFEKYYEEIKDYFELIPMSKYLEKKYINIYRTNLKNSDYSKNDYGISNTNINLNLNNILSSDINKKKDGIIWSLEPKKYNVLKEKMSVILSSVRVNPLIMFNAYNLLGNKIKKTLKNKVEIIMLSQNRWCKNLSLINPKFYDCDFIIDHVDYVEKFIFENRWVLINGIAKYKYNLQESYNFIRDLNHLVNTNGSWVLDILSEYLITQNSVIKPTLTMMTDYIENQKVNLKKNLIEPLDLTEIRNVIGYNTEKNVIVIEIVSELDINYIGNRMNNCIKNPGHYKGRIESGFVKMITIETDNNLSAMELHIDPLTYSYRLHQILSYNNRTTSELHLSIGKFILNYLNKKSLIENYQKLINCFDNEIDSSIKKIINEEDIKTDSNKTLYGNYLDNDYGIIRDRQVNIVQNQNNMIYDRIQVEPPRDVETPW